MLQGTTAVRRLQPTWKPLLGALRYQSTVNSVPKTATPETAEATESKSERTPLSARLGGSGRGKPMAAAVDPFSKFLNAKSNERPRTNNDRPRRPGQGRPQKQAAQGQFEDAPEKRREGNRQPRQQQQRQQQQQQRPRDNNRRNEKPVRREAKSQTRRAVTFIDKDIDWASLDTMQSVHEDATLEGQEDSEQIVLDMQGDYSRYVSVAEKVEWSELADANALGTLVGNNATYGIPQKAAFLATVSRVTTVPAQARE
ncbi:hypothetical protein DFQ28_002520 [Apophysomyces sp. BC1034]|nr:hypothetical protein DFQ30_002884 [Apophysomyces sp. BC1015]KAG0179646.1 hypothetical protein DFQ29_001847 [Apophysomyces sp. BC1021]KAG0190078.1 hypothetical protein DFQ28_002520 [Apophysomyces sp. BC1034]